MIPPGSGREDKNPAVTPCSALYRLLRTSMGAGSRPSMATIASRSEGVRAVFPPLLVVESDDERLPFSCDLLQTVAYHAVLHDVAVGAQGRHPGPHGYRVGEGQRRPVATSDGGKNPPTFSRSHALPRWAQSVEVGEARGLEVADEEDLSLIHISEPTRLRRISYAVF